MLLLKECDPIWLPVAGDEVRLPAARVIRANKQYVTYVLSGVESKVPIRSWRRMMAHAEVVRLGDRGEWIRAPK